MNKINTLVVDDEPLALDLVKDYVSQTPFLELIGSCSNAQEAFERISQGDIQLVFLDVQMPGMSGMTLMKSLDTEKSPKVIFTTAFDNYALEGYKLNAVDYLLKPFDFDEFMKAALKAKHLIELEQQGTTSTNLQESSADYFFVKSEYKLVRIDIAKIIYIEGLKDYIKIYIEGQPKPVLTINTLKDMEARLPSDKFIRVQRSFIININFLKGVERNLIIIGDTKIPIGEGYKQNFTEIINQKTL